METNQSFHFLKIQLLNIYQHVSGFKLPFTLAKVKFLILNSQL